MSRISIVLALLVAPFAVPDAAAQCSSALAASGSYGIGANGNAQYVVYMPQPASCFKGVVLLFAHGYVPVGAPAGTWLSQLQLPNGTSLPALVNGLGIGFAASSFSKDGLAVLQGIQDTKALVNVLHGLHIPFYEGLHHGGFGGRAHCSEIRGSGPVVRGRRCGVRADRAASGSKSTISVTLAFFSTTSSPVSWVLNGRPEHTPSLPS